VNLRSSVVAGLVVWVAAAVLVLPQGAQAAFTYQLGLGLVEDAGNGVLNIQLPDGTIITTHGPDPILPDTAGLLEDPLEPGPSEQDAERGADQPTEVSGSGESGGAETTSDETQADADPSWSLIEALADPDAPSALSELFDPDSAE